MVAVRKRNRCRGGKRGQRNREWSRVGQGRSPDDAGKPSGGRTIGQEQRLRLPKSMGWVGFGVCKRSEGSTYWGAAREGWFWREAIREEGVGEPRLFAWVGGYADSSEDVSDARNYLRQKSMPKTYAKDLCQRPMPKFYTKDLCQKLERWACKTPGLKWLKVALNVWLSSVW